MIPKGAVIDHHQEQDPEVRVSLKTKHHFLQVKHIPEQAVSPSQKLDPELTVSQGQKLSPELTVSQGQKLDPERTVSQGQELVPERTVSQSQAGVQELVVSKKSMINYLVRVRDKRFG